MALNLRPTKLRHIVSAVDFDKPFIEEILDLAAWMEKKPRDHTPLRNMIVATLFYKPSTRTRGSFESAILRLGGGNISTENGAEFSSAVKGESLEDTIKVFSGYCDAIVLRHPDNDSAERAARVATVPIINAGSGTAEHPTQALLDLYTIRKRHGQLQNLRIVFAGDLRNGRTVHSLLRLLALYPQRHVTLLSPPELRIGPEYTQFLNNKGISFSEVGGFDAVRPQDVDVLYMTRVQREYLPDGALVDAESSYTLNRSFVEQMSEGASVMHPLPRNSELPTDIDDLPQAQYFPQAYDGVPVRMALLQWCLCS